jgi:hypothetical protein
MFDCLCTALSFPIISYRNLLPSKLFHNSMCICLVNEIKILPREKLTINVPVVYMALDVMILMYTN